MMLTNFHTHCYYCDGKGVPEDYVVQAIEKNFTALGFSSHAPIPFPNEWTMKNEDVPLYCDEILRLKERYRGSIRIYLGLEIDYIPGLMGPADTRFSELGLDYTIGSVHMMNDPETGSWKALDGPQEEYDSLFRHAFRSDAKTFVEHYYTLIAEMAREHRPDIIGHFDVIMKNNRGKRLFSGEEPWYADAASGALEAVKNSGAVLEVNSGGLARGRTDFLYPSHSILRRAHELGIPVMMNADAHTPEGIDAFYDMGFSAIRKAGYREMSVLLDGQWKMEPLD